MITTSDGKLFVGDVQSGWTQNVGEQRETLQRDVEWRNPDEPVDYGDLDPALQNRLGTNYDILDVTDEAARLTGTIDIQAATESVPDSRPVHEALRSLTDEESTELLVSRLWADELVDLLNEKRQVVFYGPPGTGKTYLAHAIAELLVGPEQVRLVQFHPAYTYEDFFEGYRPATSEGGTIRFELRPGPFRNLARRAKESPDQAFILIIDEINRANLAKVFGELYFLLEYREKAADLLYSDEPFELPKNVYIIGTMNTADRSIALVDGAMRRRFAFVPLDPGVLDSPSSSMLDLWLARNSLPVTAAKLLRLLNAQISDDDLRIGPSYFMKSTDHSRDRIARIWRTAIVPLLEEHHYGEWAAVKKRYDFDSMWTEASAT